MRGNSALEAAMGSQSIVANVNGDWAEEDSETPWGISYASSFSSVQCCALCFGTK
jgi:hypothetical protein